MVKSPPMLNNYHLSHAKFGSGFAIAEHQSLGKKLVILNLGDGDFERGFPSITAQIWVEGDRIPSQCIGQLPPAPEIPEVYSRCFSMYKSLYIFPKLSS